MTTTVVPDPPERDAPRQSKIIKVLKEAGKPLQPAQIAEMTDLNAGNVRAGVRKMLGEALYQPSYGSYDLVARLQIHAVHALEAKSGTVTLRDVVDAVTEVVEGADSEYVEDALSNFSHNFFYQYNNSYTSSEGGDPPQKAKTLAAGEADEGLEEAGEGDPIYKVTASMGNGSYEVEDEIVGRVTGADALSGPGRDVYWVFVRGDSMGSTYQKMTMVPVLRFNPRLKEITEDDVYFFRLEGAMQIKRLQRLPGQRIRIISDNEHYPNETISIEDGVDFEILGRVLV